MYLCSVLPHVNVLIRSSRLLAFHSDFPWVLLSVSTLFPNSHVCHCFYSVILYVCIYISCEVWWICKKHFILKHRVQLYFYLILFVNSFFICFYRSKAWKECEPCMYHRGHGGSVGVCLFVVLQSWVRIWYLPSPQLTANLLVGCHLGWHLAADWPLWGATEEKMIRNEPLVYQNI